MNGLKLYNGIPGDIKREVSRNVFKFNIKHMKETLLSHDTLRYTVILYHDTVFV
jgi:hypothetical protein